MKSKENWIKGTIIGSLVVLFGLSIYFVISGWIGGHFRSADALRDYVATFGFWAPLVLALLQMFLSLLPIFPSFIGFVAGAALFGATGGFLTNYIGICAGSIAAYILANRFGTQLVSKLISIEKYDSYVEKINRSKSYPRLLFLAILLPLAPDNFLCYFSGLINMSAKKFVAIIITAKPWCILFYSIFFAYFI
jgi:uncharacterized membrane protein YdjX (TVP38/TMEM64 family)